MLNIVQLIGWGTFELVVMRDASVAIGRQSGRHGGKLLAGAGYAALGRRDHAADQRLMVQLVRRVIARSAAAGGAVVGWVGGSGPGPGAGVRAVVAAARRGRHGVMPALDLVIAMPISWPPLVVDYARHGKSGGQRCVAPDGLCTGQHVVLCAGGARRP